MTLALITYGSPSLNIGFARYLFKHELGAQAHPHVASDS